MSGRAVDKGPTIDRRNRAGIFDQAKQAAEIDAKVCRGDGAGVEDVGVVAASVDPCKSCVDGSAFADQTVLPVDLDRIKACGQGAGIDDILVSAGQSNGPFRHDRADVGDRRETSGPANPESTRVDQPKVVDLIFYPKQRDSGVRCADTASTANGNAVGPKARCAARAANIDGVGIAAVVAEGRDEAVDDDCGIKNVKSGRGYRGSDSVVAMMLPDALASKVLLVVAKTEGAVVAAEMTVKVMEYPLRQIMAQGQAVSRVSGKQ